MGFKGSYPHYRRFLDERMDIIGFQFSKWGPQFYVEIGVVDPGRHTLLDGKHFPSITLKYYKCPAHIRIGNLPFDFNEQSADSIADATLISIDAAASE